MTQIPMLWAPVWEREVPQEQLWDPEQQPARVQPVQHRRVVQKLEEISELVRGRRREQVRASNKSAIRYLSMSFNMVMTN
jgi:hypothetical protein